MLKHLVIVLFLILMSGCGTIKTAAPDHNHVDISYLGQKSYCESIPRVYSGVAYNFCVLHGEPRSTAVSVNSGFIPVIFFDFVFSAIGDTVLLPYTIHGQMTEGPLSVN